MVESGSCWKLVTAILLLAALPATVHADDVKVETILSGLGNPSGVAVRPTGGPEHYDIFVADRGTRRIVKVRSDEREKPSDAIIEFRQELPADLLFLSPGHLLVACSNDTAETYVRLYELTEDEPLRAEQTKQEVLVESADDRRPINFHALARTLANDRVPDLLIAASYGEAEQPAVWKIPLRAGTLADPEPFVEEHQPPDPAAIVVSDLGYLVVARADVSNESPASRMAFYSPIDGSKVMELSIDLAHILALAYSPRTGNLYAAASDPLDQGERCGVFRIDDASEPGKPACRAVKIADLVRPTALAFGPEGTLYVTVDGETAVNGDHGALIRLTGNL